jgi:hypothetical protein
VQAHIRDRGMKREEMNEQFIAKNVAVVEMLKIKIHVMICK